MANANVPRGLVPYRRTTGEPYNGSANVYYVPSSVASNIFIGDPVTWLTASADNQGIPRYYPRYGWRLEPTFSALWSGLWRAASRLFPLPAI